MAAFGGSDDWSGCERHRLPMAGCIACENSTLRSELIRLRELACRQAWCIDHAIAALRETEERHPAIERIEKALSAWTGDPPWRSR